jgi:hypothetical protein
MAPLYIDLGIFGEEGNESLGVQEGLGLQILIQHENLSREDCPSRYPAVGRIILPTGLGIGFNLNHYSSPYAWAWVLSL